MPYRNIRKGSISIGLFSMRAGSPGRSLAAAFVDWRGPGIATCSFHERRIYETLETECDRMYHVVDFRRSIVCRDTGSIDRSARQVGGHTGACSGKLVRRTDRDGEVGLRKRTKCIECTLLRYVGYGSLGLREELLPQQRARPGSACQARQRSIWLG